MMLAPPPADTATITVATSSPGATVPPDFLGFSYEVSALKDAQLATPSYATAAALLGPGIVRVGGNSVDESTWSPSPAAGDDSDLTGTDFDRLITFAQQAGWTAYLGINLATFAPDTFAAEAAYAAARPGASSVLTAVEIGNEPDLFAGSVRSTGYNGDSIAAEYFAYDTALARLAPALPRIGPAMCCRLTDYTQFLSANGAASLALLTYHQYPTAANDTTSPSSTGYPSIANLLSAALMARSAAIVDTVVAGAHARGLALRMAESNSTADGGRHGVSDVFASALWGLDWMYTVAEHGAVGVNFHGSPAGGIYSPLVDSATVIARPLFYAMLAFHSGAAGALVPTTVTAKTNVVAHATLATDGTLRVTVINKDTLNTLLVRITPAATYRSSAYQFLMASVAPGAAHASTGITFAGASVSGSGTWQPGTPGGLQKSGGTFTLPFMPAASAVVITFSP